MEPHSSKQVERENVAAGAGTVNQIVLESIGSDSEANDQFNFDADSEGGSDKEMATEPAEPQVEREKTPTEPAEPEPEEEEPQEQEELEPQFSPVESSSTATHMKVTALHQQVPALALKVTQGTNPTLQLITLIQVKKR
jgi:hypothetical protein